MSGTELDWRDLADQLSPKQLEWLTESENRNRPAGELVNLARSLASTRDERLSIITSLVAAALEGSGLDADSREHHLKMVAMMIGIIGLEGLTTPELIALNAVLTPAHGRFLTGARAWWRGADGAVNVDGEAEPRRHPSAS